MGLLATVGQRPRRRFGQHFLIDGNLMRRLVACADLSPDDMVLEVGGGTGGLTDLIARRVHHLVCVEVDGRLFGLLEERFHNVPAVTLIRGDILENKHRLLADVGRAVEEYHSEAGGCVKLVANLPYQVATPLVMNLLVDYPTVRRLCFTVQAEVGRRITACPNEKAFGPLSIVSQTLCRIETVAKIPPEAFWPRPTVDSVMIRMDVKESPLADRDELRDFISLVRATFDHRRKTLRSALGYVLPEAQRERVCQRFDGQRRPESLDVSDWLDMYRMTRE